MTGGPGGRRSLQSTGDGAAVASSGYNPITMLPVPFGSVLPYTRYGYDLAAGDSWFGVVAQLTPQPAFGQLWQAGWVCNPTDPPLPTSFTALNAAGAYQNMVMVCASYDTNCLNWQWCSAGQFGPSFTYPVGPPTQ